MTSRIRTGRRFFPFFIPDIDFGYEFKYRENFKSKKGQPACDSRMALAAVLLKPAYKGLSDEDITQVIAENPYLQYFLGLHDGYLKRNLGYIDEIVKKHPDCLKQVLSRYKAQCLEVIRLLFTQQQEMFQKNTHRVENRIVSIRCPEGSP